MDLTPHKLMQALRAAAVLAGVVVAVLLTGPFRYSDFHMPFPDKVAHALMFYGLGVLMLAALPRSRALDMAAALVVIGGLSEVVQGLVGRDMELGDWIADSLGVAAAFAPAAVAQFRALVKRRPHATFAELRRLDRRRPRAAEPAVQQDLFER